MCLFGTVESTWVNGKGDKIILINEKSGAIKKNKLDALPKKFEINITDVFESKRYLYGNCQPSFQFYDEDSPWGRKSITESIIAFTICVRFNSNNKVSGFSIKRLESLDLDGDISCFLSEIYETERANTTSLPIYQYMKYIGSNMNRRFFVFNNFKYEMAFISNIIFYDQRGLPISPDSLNPPEIENDYGLSGRTLVNLYKDDDRYLSIINISLIFDKFYRPVRGLGFNFEYRYGESVRYHISDRGDIVHEYRVDKVSDRADTSRDRSSSTKTIVIRLGDQLTDEMLTFLKEPVKGHYTPLVLF